MSDRESPQSIPVIRLPSGLYIPVDAVDSFNDEAVTDGVDESFIYDVAARFNETVGSTVDAIDSAIVAILAGTFAVAVFAIDKIRELQAVYEDLTLTLLVLSAAFGVYGYSRGFPLWKTHRQQDGILPRRLIADLAEDPDGEAIGDATSDLIAAGERNLEVRREKRIAAIASLLLLIVACAVVALARLGGQLDTLPQTPDIRTCPEGPQEKRYLEFVRLAKVWR